RYNVVMRRWSSIAAFSLILLTLPVWAQRGGRGGGGGAHFSGGGSAHVASGSGHSFGVRSSSAIHGGSIGRSSGVRVRTRTTYYTRRGSYRRGYPYAAYYPWGYYPWYSGLWDDNSGDQDSYAAGAAPVYPAPYAEDSGLGRDVQALSGKIDRLQADVEARN